MTQETWTAVDNYFDGLLVPKDSALDDALAACAAANLPAIQVSSVQGKLLHLLARIMGARNILEIGTLGGYSTIWMARALPEGGRIITLEADPKHAEVARKNFARAGVESKVELRLGKALETLPHVATEGRGPFDMCFIDANKSNMPEYFEWSLKLSRKGSVIIADNVVREGAVLDANSKDADIQGIRRFLEMVGKEKRVSATALQTVSTKSYDGFALVLVTS
ncbi:MAG TPA: O-methyltransferase [Candidatus Acidoferrales bacterium]|jgi:predicted O-methyltransferase YrrM|nr:O-methyltransferase [Candidatus Acidoferrales bacterium]